MLARIARNSSYVSAQPGRVRRGVRFRTLPKWVKATTYELCCCTVRGQRAVVSRSGVRGMNPEKLGEAAKNEAILLNSAPRRAGYEAPFVRALYPMRWEQPGTARINPEEKSATSEPNIRTSDDRERVIESLAQLLSSGGRYPRC